MKKNENLEVALTVSELVSIIKKQLESEFGELFIEGEISNLTQSSTGHWYFNISDQESTISCCLFRNQALSVKEIFNVKNGDKIKIYGDISLYAKRTTIQIIVKKLITFNKEGELKRKFELLKAKLSQEGFFDINRKKKIPDYVTKVAVISAENAAALKDFLTVMKRRSLQYKITIIPALVQGEKAPASLIKALEKVDVINDFDVVVLTRGGGSQEDLWCFNDEMLIRKIAQSKIPVISAVGHEVDFTLCDFVADLRCETPTAAAEILSSKQLKMQELFFMIRKQLQAFGLRKLQYVKYLIDSHKPSYQIKLLQNMLLKRSSRLNTLQPRKENLERKLYQSRIQLEQSVENIVYQVQQIFLSKNNYLEKIHVHFNALDPFKVLGRGYAILQNKAGEIITSTKKLSIISSGEEIHVQFSDGKANLIKK